MLSATFSPTRSPRKEMVGLNRAEVDVELADDLEKLKRASRSSTSMKGERDRCSRCEEAMGSSNGHDDHFLQDARTVHALQSLPDNGHGQADDMNKDEDTVEEFREGVSNVLIATNVTRAVWTYGAPCRQPRRPAQGWELAEVLSGDHDTIAPTADRPLRQARRLSPNRRRHCSPQRD